MDKKIIMSTILFIIVLIFSIFAIGQKKEKNKVTIGNADAIINQQTNKIIFFYGDGCPHCAKVEEYFKKNDIQDKISFDKKEVYHNKNNASELAIKAKQCGLTTNSIGIPFLWTGKKCLIGDENIINFFKQKN